MCYDVFVEGVVCCVECLRRSHDIRKPRDRPNTPLRFIATSVHAHANFDTSTKSKCATLELNRGPRHAATIHNMMFLPTFHLTPSSSHDGDTRKRRSTGITSQIARQFFGDGEQGKESW